MNAPSNNYLRPNAIVPISSTVTHVESIPRCKCVKVRDKGTKTTPLQSILLGNTEYVFGKSPISKSLAKNTGITQIRMGYREYKQMLRNTYFGKPSRSVIPLPVRTPQTVRLLPAPKPSRISQVIAIAGLSQTCTIEKVFNKWDETWVQARHPYGIATRKLSEIGE